MSHTYASVESFQRFLRDAGDTQYASTLDAIMLTILEGASRRVDGFCGRSRFGSGFGPRFGTNTYDADGSLDFDLDDDLLALGTVTGLSGTGSSATTLTLDTDFYLKPYSTPPYRALEITGLGSLTPYGLKGLGIAAATWGYGNTTVANGTVIGTLTASQTNGTVSATVETGWTLLIGAEQLYVTVGGTALTWVRGVNGTTAGTAAAGAVLSYYTYDAAVVNAAHLVSQRRWKARDAGVSGEYGGMDGETGGPRDTEWSILRSTVGHLRRIAVG